ncbi:MAG: hypothetical protein ACREX3_00095 [Gammaproteobacteria bacterium]
MPAETVAEELRRLRKGRGALDPPLAEHLGDQLRDIWKISPDADPASARVQIADRLEELSAKLPEEDHSRLIFRVVFALESGKQFRFIKARREWLMAQFEWSERTLRYKEDDAIELAASYLVPVNALGRPVAEETDALAAQDTSTANFPRIRELHLDGWYWASLKVFVTVSGFDSFEVMEDHTIIATRDDVNFVGFVLEGLPGFDGKAKFFPDIGRDAHTCFVARQRISQSCVHDLYELRRPLSAGQRYDLQIDRRVRRVAATAYTFSPLNRCDEFEIELEFSKQWVDRQRGVALDVGHADGLPPLAIRDHIEEYYTCDRSWDYRMGSLEQICWLATPDGEDGLKYSAKFEGLRPGLSYGFLWDWICSHDSNDSFGEFIERARTESLQARDEAESVEVPQRPLLRRLRRKHEKDTEA